jgi:outer membrane protein assembly factor BamB
MGIVAAAPFQQTPQVFFFSASPGFATRPAVAYAQRIVSTPVFVGSLWEPFMPALPRRIAIVFSLVFCGLVIASGRTLTAAEQTGVPRRVIAGDDSTRTLAAIAADGSVEWKLPVGPIHDLHLLPGGHLLYQDSWTHIVEVDANREVVWEYDAKTNGNENRPVEVHAFQRLPNGHTMIVESGPARIIEVDRDGKIQNGIPLAVDQSSTHSDTRNARKTASGSYLVAHERDGTVREYDGKGSVIWEYKVPLFGRERAGGHGPEAFGNQLYSAVRLPNGNTLIGTGNGHSVIEVTPEKEIVWKLEQNDLDGITLAWVTQVERLPNGNTRLVNCHAGPDNPQIIEVTPAKEVVWTFHDFNIFGNSMPVAVVLPRE